MTYDTTIPDGVREAGMNALIDEWLDDEATDGRRKCLW
jgi:hypothetical protein